MPTSEALSGATAQRSAESFSMRDRALILTVIAVLFGVAAAGTAIWDWADDIDIPNTLPIILAITAVGAAFAALVFHTRHAQAQELERIFTKIRAELAQIPASAATRLKVGGSEQSGRDDYYWTIYTDVLRDLAGLTNTGELPEPTTD